MIHILICDDHTIVRQGLRQILADTDDIVVAAEAGNGAEALRRAREGGLDLVLLDINMPEMNGLEFVTAVRADKKFRGMTLMMVTTESEHGQIVRALAAGAHEYVIKPFTPDAIVDKLVMLGLIPDGAHA